MDIAAITTQFYSKSREILSEHPASITQFLEALQLYAYAEMCMDMFRTHALKPLPVPIDFDSLHYARRRNLMSFFDVDNQSNMYIATLTTETDLLLDARLYARHICPVNDIEFLSRTTQVSLETMRNIVKGAHIESAAMYSPAEVRLPFNRTQPNAHYAFDSDTGSFSQDIIDSFFTDFHPTANFESDEEEEKKNASKSTDAPAVFEASSVDLPTDFSIDDFLDSELPADLPDFDFSEYKTEA